MLWQICILSRYMEDIILKTYNPRNIANLELCYDCNKGNNFFEQRVKTS